MWRILAAVVGICAGVLVGCGPTVHATPTKSDATITPKQPEQVAAQVTASTPTLTGVCRLSLPAGAVIWPEPGAQAPTQTLDEGATLPAEARTSEQALWYRVSGGWVRAADVITQGACETLPLVALLPAPTPVFGTGGPNLAPAPFDTDTYTLTVDANEGAVFEEVISYPEGDQIDRVRLTAPNANHPFTLRLTCTGTGAASLRWGTPANPALGCGRSIETTFTPEVGQRSLIVIMPEDGAAGTVRYRLEVAPAAPADAEAFLLPLYKDTGGRVAEAISYPSGDTRDVYVMQVEDFAPEAAERQRTFAVQLNCTGGNLASVRWGRPGEARFLCNQPVTMDFDVEQTQRTIEVLLPPGSEQGYITYRLLAVPVAPQDSDTYLFTADRSSGGQLGESISGPHGDTTDTIQFTLSNLTAAPPHNFRQVQLTLLCNGAGVEQVRWGQPDDLRLGCGESLVMPVLYGAPVETLVVTTEGTTFVNYTLVAQPALP